jgi:hypothetical protein
MIRWNRTAGADNRILSSHYSCSGHTFLHRKTFFSLIGIYHAYLDLKICFKFILSDDQTHDLKDT